MDLASTTAHVTGATAIAPDITVPAAMAAVAEATGGVTALHGQLR
ncbi:MAG TPA: hypothetical protein VFG13_05470 [Blastococcus sp.]|nr:hypothetical protein [Blastococcus sp.]